MYRTYECHVYSQTRSRSRSRVYVHTASYAAFGVSPAYELLVEEKGMITMYSILFIRLNAKRIHSVIGSLGRLFGSETASDLGPFSP